MSNFMFSKRELFVKPMLKPKPQMLIVGGRFIDGGKVQQPVGAYDAIRRDVRRLSSVEPVEDIAVERMKYGWRGVLVSGGTPYIFVMSGDGFLAQKPDEEKQPKTWQRFREILDVERQLTQTAREREADQEIDKFNTQLVVPTTMQAGDLGLGTKKEKKFTGPTPGKFDPVERVPEAYQEGFTQKWKRYGLKKAKKPYGHIGYQRRDPRTNKLLTIAPKGVKTVEVPVPKAKPSAIAVSGRREPKPEPLQQVSMRRVRRTLESGLRLYRLQVPKWGSDEIVSPSHVGHNITGEEATLLFNELKKSKHKTLAEFCDDVVAEYWDPDTSENPEYDQDEALNYMRNMLWTFEHHNLVPFGSRDLSTKYSVNWDELARDFGAIGRQNQVKPAQRRVREAVRRIIEHSGSGYSHSVGNDLEPKVNTITVDKRMRKYVAHREWDGKIVISSRVRKRAQCILEIMAADLLQEGSGSWSTKVITITDLEGFKTLLHEEMHCCSNISSVAYRGVGAVVEEVVTEVAARAVLKGVFPNDSFLSEVAYEKSPLAVDRVISNLSLIDPKSVGSYHYWITGMRTSIEKAAQLTPEEAAERLEKASLKMKSIDAPRSFAPLYFLGYFADALELEGAEKLAFERDVEMNSASWRRKYRK